MDLDALAVSATEWIQRALDHAVVVGLALPDRAGRLHTVWTNGDGPHLGRKRSARRREAFDGRRAVRLEAAELEERSLGILPLVGREQALGVLEVLGPRHVIDRGWTLLTLAAAQIAVGVQNLTEQRTLRREIETLERAALLGRDLVQAGSPCEATRVAARFASERFEIPVAVWLAGRDPSKMRLTAVRGLGSRRRRDVRARMGTIPRWGGLFAMEQERLMCRFGEVLGTSEVVAIDAGDALMLAAHADPSLEAALEVVGSLLRGVLRNLSVTEQAEQRNQQLDFGIALTAHELRAPILGVKAVLELLLGRERQGGFETAMLRRSLRELEQLADVTEGILGWAVGAQPLNRKHVDVVALVTDVVRSSELGTDEGRVVICAPERVEAFVDPLHFRGAVGNILRNALAYTEEGTAVHLVVEQAEDRVAIRIRDRGPGIAEDERASVFDPFVRGRVGLVRSRGNGLGLFIARRVVEAHGGDIWIESEREGTTFHLSVPTGTVRARRSAS
jgi:signal transduction histidine kinase